MPGKKHTSPKRMRCECGRFAVHRLRLVILRPDLVTPLAITLYLCESCYQLEQKLHWADGLEPPKAVRIG